MSLQAEFERVADDVKKVKSRPSDQELLDMYGLYKQAIFGDINIDKPGMLDMKGKAKWEAWDSRKETGLCLSCILGLYHSPTIAHCTKWYVQGGCHDSLHRTC
uniref:ACB domain-containing protein n=1 Tax=Oncorhynchus tshawytscha TaxID=74940 RepID=A0A8C8LPG5_ONCTS